VTIYVSLMPTLFKGKERVRSECTVSHQTFYYGCFLLSMYDTRPLRRLQVAACTTKVPGNLDKEYNRVYIHTAMVGYAAVYRWMLKSLAFSARRCSPLSAVCGFPRSAGWETSSTFSWAGGEQGVHAWG